MERLVLALQMNEIVSRSILRITVLSLLAFAGLCSFSVQADVRSKDPKDLNSIRYSKGPHGTTVLELCGPKGCRALGPVQLVLDKKEIDDLRMRETFQYYSNKSLDPVLLIAMPAAGAIRGVISAKITLAVAEKYLPYVTSKLFEKFGTRLVVNSMSAASATVNAVEMGALGYELTEELFNSEENKVAREALSDRALDGEDIHGDFSIEQLARHLEAELVEKQMAKDLVEEQKENRQFDWPM